jgi:hypothetical protein
LARLVRSPVFSAQDQAKALKGDPGKAGRPSPHRPNSCCCWRKSVGLFALNQIIAAYEHLVAKSRGETEAKSPPPGISMMTRSANSSRCSNPSWARNLACIPASTRHCWAA